ncbi:hypothetical protein AO377_0483 [Moraxella catarrhalis]|uniref:Uncharacterized protein n=1 Tax=Moraxella catarrhalis TaxID=480 RepID=A0A198UW96_MORCA|nr:hypothetical protein AO382_1325 [Moraxella catarrhalis]OAV03203.1 hypothetical protein AO381_1222 [Moraxella catarrhalis]OAV08061.1 hypothetical protein AO378_1801 [Moraxella catarrhalis]OAV11318.1 hypothetical protein AO377_0483 [Moraxella catarrhalis]OAV12979.1 hypothetical protein AO376_1765 [Moraxella catarrhalis]
MISRHKSEIKTQKVAEHNPNQPLSTSICFGIRWFLFSSIKQTANMAG